MYIFGETFHASFLETLWGDCLVIYYKTGLYMKEREKTVLGFEPSTVGVACPGVLSTVGGT